MTRSNYKREVINEVIKMLRRNCPRENWSRCAVLFGSGWIFVRGSDRFRILCELWEVIRHFEGDSWLFSAA